jgi:hypothetical protein
MKEIRAPKMVPFTVTNPNDAALKLAGKRPTEIASEDPPGKEKGKKKRARQPSRRRKQHKFTTKNEETLAALCEKLGLTESAVVNVGIATLAKEYL